MSLTSLINGNSSHAKQFQEILRQHLPAKTNFLTYSNRKAFSKYEIKIPSSFSNNYFSSVAGTAFDYLARTIIAQKVTNNKNQAYTELIAEEGLSILKMRRGLNTNNQFLMKYDNGIQLFKDFVHSKNGVDIKKIIPAACYFARLEHIFRSNMLPKDIKESLIDDENPEIIRDLEGLCNVFLDTFVNDIVGKESYVIFNPTFGDAAERIGGADADIFIDGVLYDFKTSKFTGYNWKHIAQLWGYYLLYRIAILNDDPEVDLIKKNIFRIAIYRARYGEIEYFNMNLMSEDEIMNAVNNLNGYIVNLKAKPSCLNANPTGPLLQHLFSVDGYGFE